MDEKEKIIITNLIEDKKSLWTVVIVLTGGIVSLLASINKFSFTFPVIFRILSVFLGFVVLYYMVNNLISVSEQIKKKLRG